MDREAPLDADLALGSADRPVVAAPAVDRSIVVEEWSSEPNLDALRAFAVLCVVARHLVTMFGIPARGWFQPQALGTFGVVIFFVHTSLVLMLSLDRQQARRPISQARLYAGFLVRRAFRIYPLAMAAVLLIYFALIPFADADSQRAGLAVVQDPRALLMNLFLVQDLTHSPLMEIPLWSLPAEVQMYLVLPALYFLARARGLRMFLIAVWPLAVVTAVLCKKLDASITVGLYAPCFVAGVICYLLLKSRRPLPFWMFPATLAVILGGYMVGYARIGMQAGLGIIATLVLAFAIPLFTSMRAHWLRRSTHVVAKYSYGIYLFHLPCLWLAFGKLRFMGPLGSVVAFVVLLTVVVVLGYHALEAPMIAVGKRVARNLE
jgi:peptidoglycan/LPS O-acetylase OafA/YrhL